MENVGVVTGIWSMKRHWLLTDHMYFPPYVSGYSKLPCSRRDFLSKYALIAGSALAGMQIVSTLAATSPGPVRKVVGILTWYKQGSHADVLIGKILEGWRYDGGVGPRAIQTSVNSSSRHPAAQRGPWGPGPHRAQGPPGAPAPGAPLRPPGPPTEVGACMG